MAIELVLTPAVARASSILYIDTRFVGTERFELKVEWLSLQSIIYPIYPNRKVSS